MLNKKRLTLFTSILLNIFFVLSIGMFIQHKGGLVWLGSKLKIIDQKTSQIPSLPLPDVDNRILMIGDSHLAIHPWSEYSSLPFSNRAVSGSKIEDINIEAIKGNPALIVVSTSTNNLQAKKPSSIEEIKTSLNKLFFNLKNKWPQSEIVFIAAPYPNVTIYEKFIRSEYPYINRPEPEQIDKISEFVISQGIITIKAKSANIDGLHVDIKSALLIAQEIAKLYSSHSLLAPDK